MATNAIYISNRKAHGLVSLFLTAGLSLSKIRQGAGVSVPTLRKFAKPSELRMLPETYEKLVSLFERLKQTDEEFQKYLKDLYARNAEQDKARAEAEAEAEAEEIEAEIDDEAPEISQEPQPDLVNHPNHYLQAAVTVEPIEITQYLPHPLASAFEYLVRAGHKDGQSEALDLQKARFWLRRWLQLDAPYVPMRMDCFAGLVVLRKKNPLACGMLLPAAEETLRQHEEGSEVFPFPIIAKTINATIEDTIDRISNRLIELGVETKEAS